MRVMGLKSQYNIVAGGDYILKRKLNVNGIVHIPKKH